MFTELSQFATFVLASAAIVIVPGPSVTVIIAASLKYGTRAGMTNIAGTQVGMGVLLVILALGLEAITTTMAWLFDWVRLVGAAYLIWLGYKLLTSDGKIGKPDDDGKKKHSSHFWQGFFVVLSNPKVLLFFGAFLPQFINPTGSAAQQTIVLGLIFMAVAVVFDSAYAVTAGRAGRLLTKHRVRAVEIGSGTLMLGGGVWLALSRN